MAVLGGSKGKRERKREVGQGGVMEKKLHQHKLGREVSVREEVALQSLEPTH